MAGTSLTTAQSVGVGALAGILDALKGDDTRTGVNPTASQVGGMNGYMPLIVAAVIAVVVVIALKR